MRRARTIRWPRRTKCACGCGQDPRGATGYYAAPECEALYELRERVFVEEGGRCMACGAVHQTSGPGRDWEVVKVAEPSGGMRLCLACRLCTEGLEVVRKLDQA